MFIFKTHFFLCYTRAKKFKNTTVLKNFFYYILFYFIFLIVIFYLILFVFYLILFFLLNTVYNFHLVEC